MQGSSILYDFREIQYFFVAAGTRTGIARKALWKPGLDQQPPSGSAGHGRSPAPPGRFLQRCQHPRSPRLTYDPNWPFLMVAIRNLYWTEAIGAFIVGGLSFDKNAVRGLRRGDGGFSRWSEPMPFKNRARLTKQEPLQMTKRAGRRSLRQWLVASSATIVLMAGMLAGLSASAFADDGPKPDPAGTATERQDHCSNA